MFEDNEDVYFYKFVFVLIHPFFLLALFSIPYFLYLLIKNKKFDKNQIKDSLSRLFLIITYILQPNIVETCFEMFRCKNFLTEEDPIYYMDKEPQVKCWTGTHIIWSLAVALPALIFWAFLLPYSLYRILKKQASNLEETEIYAKYSFVYEGFKTDKFYW